MGTLKRRIIESMEPKEEPPMQDIVHELRSLEVRTDVCYHGDEVRLFNSTMRDAANEIERLRLELFMRPTPNILVKAARWIAVEERLPEIDENVLACSSGEVGISHRYVDGWYWDVDEWHKPFTPSHWQPLPEPPTEKGNDDA